MQHAVMIVDFMKRVDDDEQVADEREDELDHLQLMFVTVRKHSDG